MRNRIEGVYERVVACATEEFLKKGYTDTSLRTIAEKAETSTNSIYVRFKDKEGLFAAIVEPVSEEFISRCLDVQETFHGFDGETQRREAGTYSSNAMLDMMETTLAHFFPEMTANVAGPVLIIIYLFILDWRMALLSLVTIPLGMIFMMSVMGNYSKDYEGAVKTTQEMNETVVEYINGIEVIKVFNQGKSSYAKFADRVRANASYYYNWMKKSQLGVSTAYAILPAALVTILPVGWIWYRGGSLPMETFIMVIVLSLGIAGPLIAAMNFVDTLAIVGTTVASVDELLSAEEQQHGDKEVHINSLDIELSHVSFGYHEDKEILCDVNLSIPAGSMTALVGPSGSGKSTIAKLIAGFWDVKDGTVSLGGLDEKKIPLKQLYDKVAFVSQDNYLFDASVRENIRMGKLSATDQEIVVLSEGCVAEEGTPDELYQKEGIYSHMVTIQTQSQNWVLG